MEVSMETSPGLSPLPHQPSYPATPTCTQKRSIQDVDVTMSDPPSPSARRQQLDTKNPEDQENTDPAGSGVGAADSSTDRSKEPAEPSALTAGSTGVQEGSAVNTVPNSNSNSGVDGSGAQSSAAGTPAAKKRKLSPTSKDAKQQEKEAKERQKLEEKAKKEEEKAKKEEEKAKREEEKRAKEEEKRKRDVEREEERKRKEEKKKAKDEEKAAKEGEKRKKDAAKEEEKRKKEEEKLKKERAQPKLNAFFAKPKPTAISNVVVSPKKPTGDGPSNESSEVAATALNDYKRELPDFFLQSHTIVAPPHRFERDEEALRLMREKVDSQLKSADNSSEVPPVLRPSEIFHMMPYKRRRGQLASSVKEILLQMQDENDKPGNPEVVQKRRSSLRQIRMKSLKFGEDIRPPYQGTYTKRLPESSAHKMMRNPFYRGLPEANYDYDSEGEWEEPEEGEELDSEEEEEASEDGDDDMDGFLDDEDDHPVDGKRRLIVGDLEPVCTGVRWEEPGAVDPELQVYKMETIQDTISMPIDPFSTAYWEKPKTADPPGRTALQAFVGQRSSSASTTEAVTGKAKRAFPVEQLESFKEVVNGSDLTKMGLIEILKKRFPKVSKEVLKDTLNNLATRVGQKEAEKQWVCK